MSSSSAISLMTSRVLVFDLLAFEGGQPGESHVQDGLSCDLGQAEARDQVVAGGLDVGRLPDGSDHLVEVVEGDLEAFQDVRPSASLSRSNSVRRRTTSAVVE